MKINTYFWVGTMAVLTLCACRDEDKIRIPEPQRGVNMRWVIDPDHQQINYQTVATDYFAFDAFSENKDLDLVEVIVRYQDQVVIAATWTQADFDDGTQRFEFTANQFAELFGVPGFADGSRGGNFAFSPRVTLNDGRVYPDYVHVTAQDSFLNLGTGVTGAANGAFTVRLNTAITCAPLDISGTYSVISAKGTSTDGCCPGVVEVSGDVVEITAVSETLFNVSDITGGIYLEWYDVYGITSPDDSPGQLSYNCSEVLIPNSPEPFGTVFQGGGVYDPDTKRLTYHWINGYADEATIILEKL